MEIKDDGRLNPLITISKDEIVKFLREQADKAGYADRELSAVQINVETPFEGGKTFHHEPPSLTVMVSNIKNSRRP